MQPNNNYMDFSTRLSYLRTGLTGVIPTKDDSSGYVYGYKNVEVDTSTVEGQAEALNKCSVVQACVVLRADAFLNLKIWAKDYDGRKIKLNN